MVADQFICAIKTERKLAIRKRHRYLKNASYEECSDPNQKADSSNMKIVLRKFVNYCKWVIIYL